MGGSSPNSDLFFFSEILCFLCCFCCCTCFQKKNGHGGEWVLSGQSEFFLGFLDFFLLDKTLKHAHPENIYTYICFFNAEGDASFPRVIQYFIMARQCIFLIGIQVLPFSVLILIISPLCIDKKQ